jgi:hypothetical protein
MITASALHGQIPPPFESVAGKRWVEENKATPYTQAEKLPVRLSLSRGQPVSESRS